MAFHKTAMAKRYSFLLIFTILIHINGVGQHSNLFFDFTGGGGRLIPHHPELKNLAGSVAFYNVRLGFQTQGAKEWQRLYNYPQIGIGLSHNYLTKSFLGNPTSLYSFLNLPLTSGSKLKLDLGMHLGLACGIHPFSEQNQQNIALGSKCAAYASLNLNASVRISQNIDLLLYAGGYHYSNGNTNKPNKGLNMLGTETGLRYTLQESYTKRNTDPVTPKEPRSSILLFGALGWKKEATYSSQYRVGSLSAGYYRSINHKSRLSAGLDLFYDEGILYYTNKENRLNNVVATGFFGGHELTFDKFSIVTQVGIYLRNPHPYDPFYYERLGLRTVIAKRIVPSISLKAHEFKIDFVEWGVGFILWNSK